MSRTQWRGSMWVKEEASMGKLRSGNTTANIADSDEGGLR